MYLGEDVDAYDAFFKATWSNEQQEMSFYYLAVLDAKSGRYAHALEMAEKGLVKNAHNIKARALKVYLLRRLGMLKEAKNFADENLRVDAFDFVSGFELAWMAEEKTEKLRQMKELMRGFHENYLMAARDYAEFGAWEEALSVLAQCANETPMKLYYEAYYLAKQKDCDGAAEKIRRAEAAPSDYCFPNKLEDIAVLSYAVEAQDAGMAAYYLGNLYYDKLQRKKAVALWEMAADRCSAFPTVHRNLALAYYNECGEKEKAKEAMERAFALNPTDVRVFLELDQLYKKLRVSYAERLKNYEAHRELIGGRDDLFIEYITLHNMTGQYEKAFDLMQGRRFHPWEGGEGKITAQYTLALVQMAKEALAQREAKKAEQYLRKALVYPENLGEGKLEGTKDNHIYYHLGLALSMQGKDEEAAEYFAAAAVGTDEPAGMMYYNDQPADMIYYQGLARLKQGRETEAKARFYRLIDYGEKHLWDEVKIEYFAVSLPEFQIFNEDYTVRNRAHCYYLMALGRWGLGECETAREYFAKALELEPSHMQCNIYGREVQS